MKYIGLYLRMFLPDIKHEMSNDANFFFNSKIVSHSRVLDFYLSSSLKFLFEFHQEWLA